MSDKYFPIKTETACQLKWTWSTVRLYSGITSSCHRASFNKITADNFDSFHNTPAQLTARQTMLEGKWPQAGCEYCKKIEDVGGYSDRMLQLEVPNLAPPELDIDPTAIEVTPRILEVYFDNVCNMKCIYCWDGFSSQIQQENIRFGHFEKDGVVLKNTATKVPSISAITEQFWSWMDRNHKVLRRLHVLGGEPLYQKQFEDCLTFFETHPCPDLEFNVISNLMIDHSKFCNIIERIKNLLIARKLKRFDLTASIDCWGPEQEYIRSGIKLDHWSKNFEHAVAQPWLMLHVNQALSNLGMKTVPDLYKYINGVKQGRKITHYFSTTELTHECLHPGIFGPGYFDKDFEAIYELMPKTTDQEIKSVKYMQGIQKEINSRPRDAKKLHQLTVLLDELDRRRNTNWKETFTWVEEEVKRVV